MGTLRYSSGRFAVDISVNQFNGLATLEIINSYLHEMPALRPLATVVKGFLRERNMNEVYNGGLGSYSTICMIVSFLQMHPKIRQGEIDPTENLGVLLLDFLEFYGQLFNTTDVAISLRDGGKYFSKADRGWHDSTKPHLLSIEDPHDPSNDVSKGSYQIRQVLRTLAGAHEILTAAAYQRAASLDSRSNGRRTSFRKSGDRARDSSLLGSIMGVSQETINHRQMVQELMQPVASHPNGRSHLSLKDRLRSPSPPRNARNQRRTEIVAVRDDSDMEMSDTATRRSPEWDDASRYDINRVKHQRLKRPAFSFTTDEEDEEEDGEIVARKMLESEHTSEASEGAAKAPPLSSRIGQKRAYWAAKTG